MPDEQDATVAETELEAMRKHGHPNHPDHPDRPDHPHHPHGGGDDGDDDGDGDDSPEAPDTPELPDEPTSTPEEDRHLAIAKIAYHLWEGRGRGDGHAKRDWHDAEAMYEVDHHPVA